MSFVILDRSYDTRFTLHLRFFVTNNKDLTRRRKIEILNILNHFLLHQAEISQSCSISSRREYLSGITYHLHRPLLRRDSA
jgi:hypothetical protein